jgi:hypothetical protein
MLEVHMQLGLSVLGRELILSAYLLMVNAARASELASASCMASMQGMVVEISNGMPS